VVWSGRVDPCARCGFANPAEARFCGECGEVLRGANGPRTADLKAEPSTLRDPPRDGQESLARLDLQREIAAENAWRFLGASRLLERLAAHSARSARIGGVVNLAAARATAIGSLHRAKAAGTTANEHFTSIARASSDTALRSLAGASTANAIADGIRPEQRDEDVAFAIAGDATRFSELASATTQALDAGQAGWSAESMTNTLRELASAAQEHAKEAARIECERRLELEDLTRARADRG
jgi:hypothetical protein